MAKCHRNDVGSLVLDGPTTAGHSRIWTSFSGSAFRRKLFNAMSCGGGGSRHRPKSDFVAETRSVSKPPEKPKKAKSEKLSDLLNMPECSSSETDTDGETKKKVEALEELKLVAKELQGEDSAKRKVIKLSLNPLIKQRIKTIKTPKIIKTIKEGGGFEVEGIEDVGDHEADG